MGYIGLSWIGYDYARHRRQGVTTPLRDGLALSINGYDHDGWRLVCTVSMPATLIPPHQSKAIGISPSLLDGLLFSPSLLPNRHPFQTSCDATPPTFTIRSPRHHQNHTKTITTSPPTTTPASQRWAKRIPGYVCACHRAASSCTTPYCPSSNPRCAKLSVQSSSALHHHPPHLHRKETGVVVNMCTHVRTHTHL